MGFNPDDGKERPAVVMDDRGRPDVPAVVVVATGGALDRDASAGESAATAVFVGVSSVNVNAVARGTAYHTSPNRQIQERKKPKVEERNSTMARVKTHADTTL
jgi:hypothetical protein